MSAKTRLENARKQLAQAKTPNDFGHTAERQIILNLEREVRHAEKAVLVEANSEALRRAEL